MTDAQMDAYILFASVTIFVFCAGGLLILLAGVVPDAVAAARTHESGSPAGVYSRWQLFRLGMHCLKLALFLVPGFTIIFMELSDLRTLVNVTALFVIAVAVAVTAITEPVGRRQGEGAIREEGATRKEGMLREQVERLREDREKVEEHQERMEGMQQEDLDISERVETKLDEAKQKLEEGNGNP